MPLQTSHGDSRLYSGPEIDDSQVIMRGPWVRMIQPSGKEYFRHLLMYIFEVSETPDSDFGPLMAELGPDAEEIFVTTVEMIEARTAARILTRVLTAKFGPLPESTTEKVDEASIDQVEEWTTRAATVATLDEVFG